MTTKYLGYRRLLNKNIADLNGLFHNKKHYEIIKNFVDSNDIGYDTKEIINKIAYKYPNVDMDIIYNCVNYKLFGTPIDKDFSISERGKIILNKLNNLILPEQRTEAWFKQRRGKVTASVVGAILGLEKYNTRDDILYRKLTSPTYSANKWTEHGVCFEEVVTRIYSELRKVKVREYGLIQSTEYPWLAASPDGIAEDGICIEIKCPMGSRNFGNIFHKDVSQYLCQMQLQLGVCRLPYGDFVDCYIKTYYNEGDFYEHNGVSRYTLDGMPRGVVGVFQHKKEEFGKNVYIYPGICQDVHLQIKDINNQKNNISLDINTSMYEFKLKYWYCEQFVIHRIKRNKNWFKNVLVPQTRAFKDEWDNRKKNGNDLSNLKLKSYKKSDFAF